MKLIPKYLTAPGPLPKIGTPEALAYLNQLKRLYKLNQNISSETILNNSSIRVNKLVENNRKAENKGKEIRQKRERVKQKIKHNQTSGRYTQIPLSEEEQKIALYDPLLLELYATPPTILEYTDEMKAYNEKMLRLYDNQHIWNGLYLGTPHGNITRLNLPMFESIAQGNSDAINYGALASGFAAAPVRTLLAMGTGAVGHELGDKYIGGPMGGFLGMMAGAPVGFKVGTWGKNNISFSPENGLLIGRLLFKIDHNTLGAIGKNIDVSVLPRDPGKIIFERKGTVYDPVYESDLPRLREMYEKGEYTLHQRFDGFGNKVERKIYRLGGNKPPINNIELDDIFKSTHKEFVVPKKTMQAAKRLVKKISAPYLKALQKSIDIGIDWRHTSGEMSAVDEYFLAQPVGRDFKTPFIKRYYDNVMEVIKPGGLLDQLINSGELRRNLVTNLWEGLFYNGNYYHVDPVTYIKMRISLSKGNNTTLPIKDRVNGSESAIPIHGTRDKDITYLTRPGAYTGQGHPGGLMTILLKPGSSRSIELYKGSGYSIPFFRKFFTPKDVENNYIFIENPTGTTNSINLLGIDMPTLVDANPGKITEVKNIIEGTTGEKVYEYHFGPNVRDPKSIINTLDYEPGAGPFAYNTNNGFNNLNHIT